MTALWIALAATWVVVVLVFLHSRAVAYCGLQMAQQVKEIVHDMTTIAKRQRKHSMELDVLAQVGFIPREDAAKGAETDGHDRRLSEETSCEEAEGGAAEAALSHGEEGGTTSE